MKRLFVAIPIPETLRREIYQIFSKIRLLRVQRLRIVPEEHWHFTVTFLGDQDEAAIPALQSAMEQLAASREKTEIAVTLEEIVYGPFPSRRDVQMIWLVTDKESSGTIGVLKNELERGLKEKGIVWDEKEREYQGHLTLARFESVPIQSLPPLCVPIRRSYRAESLELIESHLSREGAEYEILFEQSIEARPR